MLQLQEQSSQEGGQKMIYYEHGCTRSKGPFSSVKHCTNRFFQTLVNYGKNPCFLRCAFSSVVDVDYLCLSFEVVLRLMHV